MPVAYVTEPHAVVRRRGRTTVVTKDGEELAERESNRLESLVLRGNVQLTTAAMKLLLRHGIETALLSGTGRLCRIP